MKKIINGLLFSGMVVALVALLLLSLPTPGHASCPDRVTCFMKVPELTYMDEVWKGNISTPTCWKVGHQCKPWNCSGNTTDADYWVNECIRRFNIKATKQGEKACIRMPEIKRSEHSLDGYGEHCKDLPLPTATIE